MYWETLRWCSHQWCFLWWRCWFLVTSEDDESEEEIIPEPDREDAWMTSGPGKWVLRSSFGDVKNCGLSIKNGGLSMNDEVLLKNLLHGILKCRATPELTWNPNMGMPLHIFTSSASRAKDKLQTYLQLAAAGHSPIDYVRETSGLPIEDRSFLLEPPDSESEIFTQEEMTWEWVYLVSLYIIYLYMD